MGIIFARLIVVYLYRILSNKHPGTYFLQGLHELALKRDQAFIRDPTLIFIAYFKGTMDL